MNRRTLIILLFIFIALAGVALLQSRLTAPVEETPYLRVFPDLAVLDIQAVRLRDPNSDLEFTISRGTDGQWTAPNAAAEESLDADAASNIARTVVLLHYQRTLPLDGSTRLAEYGFAPNGGFFIEVVLPDGNGHVVAVGALSGSRTVYYALVDDRQEIYLLERAPVDYLITQLAHPPLT